MSAADKGGKLPDFIMVKYAIFIDPDLTAAEKLLFSRLEFYAGADGKAYPKHETLAREMCLDERQVRRLLENLRSLNRIDWKRTRTSCIYEIKPVSEWTRMSDLDRTRMSTLTGHGCPIKSGHGCPTEKKYRKSSSKRGVEKRKPPCSKTPAPSEDQKSKPFFSDDDEPKPQVVYASPEAELQDVYRQKTGEGLSPAVERRIWETVELRDVPRKQFMDELRKHVPNVWNNPAGFLTNFARKIGSVSTPDSPHEVAPAEPEPPKNEQGRCAGCSGSGYRHWDVDLASREYCDCHMGRELKRVDERMARETTVALGASLPAVTSAVA